MIMPNVQAQGRDESEAFRLSLWRWSVRLGIVGYRFIADLSDQ